MTARVTARVTARAPAMRCFTVRARVVAALGNGQIDALRASLEALAAARDLRLDGTWAPEPSFVLHRGGHAVHDADRRATAAWAATRREFVDYTVGPLARGDGRVAVGADGGDA